MTAQQWIAALAIALGLFAIAVAVTELSRTACVSLGWDCSRSAPR